MFGKALLVALGAVLAFGGYTALVYQFARVRENLHIIRSGGAGASGVKLMQGAREILRAQVDPDVLVKADGFSDMPDLLSEQTKTKIETWLQAYDKWREKGTAR